MLKVFDYYYNKQMHGCSDIRSLALRCRRRKDAAAPFARRNSKSIHEVFPAERLNVVRDIFIFSCFTGLAYVDLEKLKRSEIIIGIDGEKWISIEYLHEAATKVKTKTDFLHYTCSEEKCLISQLN